MLNPFFMIVRKLTLFIFCGLLLTGGGLLAGEASSANQQQYDIVILNGRVIDPESKLDAILNIGISDGKVQALSPKSLRGRTTILATGMVVAPGFIDLHVHGMDAENHRYQAMDGVTTVLELEGGTADVDQWYRAREGKTLVNYGVSVGHSPVRGKVLGDPNFRSDAAHKEATEAQIEQMKSEIKRGLDSGAVAVGFGIQYTPAASRWEIQEMFRVAASYNATCHPHIRYAGAKEPESSIVALEEVIADAAITGAPLHVVHITSSGISNTAKLLQMIREAQARGIDVTTECYPYTAAMTSLQSAIFDEGWQEKLGIDYKDLQWAATGERLTAETFAKYRKEGGTVVIHLIPDSVVEAAVRSPLTMIASDGFLENGKGHPRASGTYSRVLGRYVREQKALTLADALGKMTIMPARRLERRVPAMKNKGRLRVGADADIAIFDPEKIIDKSTYEEPAKYSEGMKYVLVNGVFVVKDGQLQNNVMPGQAVRAPLRAK